ncbi:hypothetical protein PSE_2212 [Pseudovibrio sp. FO-BEG1]|nr:hypothetical protein PSE_2212 [Pseudovibrio sp. FO-BEG1]
MVKTRPEWETGIGCVFTIKSLKQRIFSGNREMQRTRVVRATDVQERV